MSSLDNIAPFLALPEVIIYQILCWIDGPTHRAHTVCHILALLSKNTAHFLLERSTSLWDAILEGDYGVQQDIKHTANTRRAAKRRRQSPIFRVRDAHLMVKDNTDTAYFYLEEMTHSGTVRLTKTRLQSILQEFGPHLCISDLTRTGGTFLVACCRAKKCRESEILKCLELLVENYQGVDLDLATRETPQSSLTPLCVAAARGMSSVVQFLLKKGASTTTTGTGRFYLHANKRRSVKCTSATPLEFCEQMRAAELQEGATNVKQLTKCIRLLQQAAP